MKKEMLVCMLVLLAGCGYESAEMETQSADMSFAPRKRPDPAQRFRRRWQDLTGREATLIVRESSSANDEPAAEPVCTEMQWQIETVLCADQGRSEGQPCEDYNPCTFADVCRNGVCAGNWYTYCIPCRRDNDCCGPSFCAGDPTDNYARGHAIVTTGLCIAGRCEQRAETCANGCAHPNGCF